MLTNDPAVHLRVRNVTKTFGAFTALTDVSLDAFRGEFLCFLGPSGCGKTTLLRVIAGLDPQTDGSIEIAGRDVSRLPPSARDFGIVFQSYALFPNLTVSQNVGYGLVNKRLKRADIRARVDELLTLVSLTDQGHKYPAQLSGGQQQRVALARALATSPSLLLLDEPLSALDARVRLRLRDELKALQRTLGITTIMVTHDQDEAMGLADRLVVMNQGVIEQIGTPSEVYAHPATAFVADFVGTMNFLHATAASSDQVRVGDLSFTAARPHGIAPGAQVRLAVRPEDIRLRDVHDGTPNRFEARISALAFHGGFCRATLLPHRAPDSPIAVDIPANDLHDLDIRLDGQLPAAMPPASLRVYPN
jgi:iron(III) transport system ATP-binding protein